MLFFNFGRKHFLCRAVFFALAACVFAQNTVEVDVQSPRSALIATAKKYLGAPYRYGGRTPDAFDCSGFVGYVVSETFGIPFSRSSTGIFEATMFINDSERLPGDLVFFRDDGTRVSHVAIFIGDNKMIHSASDGPKTGVIISDLNENYWKKTYFETHRFLSDVSEYVTQPAQEEKAQAGAAASSDEVDWMKWREYFIELAEDHLGERCSHGEGDCSAFVGKIATEAFDLEMLSTAAELYAATKRISEAEAQPGDLVFFQEGRNVSHVAIFIGGDKIVHCTKVGEKTGVRISSLSEQYWKRTYIETRRFIPAAEY